MTVVNYGFAKMTTQYDLVDHYCLNSVWYWYSLPGSNGGGHSIAKKHIAAVQVR